jgi:hypothetical protein
MPFYTSGTSIWLALTISTGILLPACTKTTPDGLTLIQPKRRTISSDSKTYSNPGYGNQATLVSNEDDLSHLLIDWAQKDAASCAEWITNEAGGKRRITKLARIVLKSIPTEDNLTRAAWAEHFQQHSSLMTEAAATWAQQSPSQACDWLLKLDDGEATLAAIDIAVRHWTKSDPEAASRYLLTMESGRKKDAAILAMSTSIAKEDIESARLWINSIDDESMRIRVTTALQYL